MFSEKQIYTVFEKGSERYQKLDELRQAIETRHPELKPHIEDVVGFHADHLMTTIVGVNPKDQSEYQLLDPIHIKQLILGRPINDIIRELFS